MRTDTFVKDKDDKLDYTIDYGKKSKWLRRGDSISTSTWTAPMGITIASDSNTSNTTTVWLEGGTVDVAYSVVNRVTTSAGRIKDQAIIIQVEDA